MEDSPNKKPNNKQFLEMVSEAIKCSNFEGEAATDFLIDEVVNSKISLGDALKEAQKTGRIAFLRYLKKLYDEKGFDSSDIDLI